jgi:hypothetical protein
VIWKKQTGFHKWNKTRKEERINWTLVVVDWIDVKHLDMGMLQQMR